MTSPEAWTKLPFMRPSAAAALAGAAIAALATLPGLGNGTLWDNSETAYGEVAREILLTRDWVVLHLNGLPWYVQPPLYFWLAAISAKIFGVGSFALRLPAALATIATGASVAYAVARTLGPRAGIYAGVILSTCLMQAVVGRLAIMDALLDLAVTIAVLSWFRALQTGRDRWFVCGAAATAFGVLAKGPVAPLISLLVISAYCFWERLAAPDPSGHLRLPSWRGSIAGILIFAAIAVPWFAALYVRAGLGAFDWLIGHYTIGRYTSTIQNQPGPFWYYLPVIILGFFPWIAFLPASVAFTVGGLRRGFAHDDEAQIVRLALCWIVIPLLFFSAAQTKLPNYLALEFPALAIIVALYFDWSLARPRSLSAIFSTAAAPLAMLFVAIAVVIFLRQNHLPAGAPEIANDLIPIGGAVLVGSVATFIFLLKPERTTLAPYGLAAGMIVAIALLAALVLPQAERFKPVPDFAATINAHRHPGDAVAIRGVAGGNALIFYTRPHVFVIARREDDPELPGVSAHSVLCGSPRIWLIGPKTLPEYDRTYGRVRRLIARGGKADLFLYDGPGCT